MGKVPQPSNSSRPECYLPPQVQQVGSGGKWLAVYAGALSGHLRALAAQGYPPALTTRALLASTEEATRVSIGGGRVPHAHAHAAPR